MKVQLAEHLGFCFGVKRAMDIVTRLVGEDNVYTLGPLIHNPQVVKDLEEKGIKYVEKIADVPKGKVVIRAHGAPSKVIQQAKNNGLEIIDATCPYVKKVHEIIKKLQKDGYQVVILGEKEHPEVIGLKENSENAVIENAVIIENLEETKKICSYEKIGLVSQTTQPKEKFKEIEKELKKHAKELKVYNTICDATEKRQQAAINLAKKVDLMIVLGGYNSGNTKRLAELCSKETETVHIEKYSDINEKILKGKENIGITAGASTPSYLIEELIQELNRTG